MSTFYLGWGQPSEGAPAYSPYLRTNTEANSNLLSAFGSARFGLDLVDGATPEEGALMAATITFTPAGSGALRVRAVDLTADSEYGPGGDFALLYPADEGDHFGPRANGVYRITAVIDGVPASNELVITIMEGGYGVASWYAEDGEPPVEPDAVFWVRHRNTREVV